MPTPLHDMTIAEALAAIADRTPVPGGGAVAGITAALAGALARMVIAFSRGKPGHAEREPLLGRSADALAVLCEQALRLAEEDARAYARLNRLWTLPKDDPERTAHMDDAVRGAAEPPRRLLSLSVDALRLLEPLAAVTARSLRSDLAIAAILANAAAAAAAWNLRMNLPLMKPVDDARRMLEEAEAALKEAHDSSARIERACGATA